MSERVLVTPRSLSDESHPSLRRLRDAGYALAFPSPGRTPSEQELLDAIPGCVGWIAGVEPVPHAVIESADRLRAISRNGSGMDNLPTALIRRKGIRLMRAAGANAPGVAELALGLAIAGLRGVVAAHEGIRQGHWPREIGKEIRGSKVAVVGVGAVGRLFAAHCAGMGASVWGVDPHLSGGSAPPPGVRMSGLRDALVDADVVSLHCPLPEDQAPMIGRREFAGMDGCSVLVNTARAGLVNEAELLRALDGSMLGAYAADVFEREPPTGSPLLKHKRVILTSHLGAHTTSSSRRAADAAVANLLDALRGS